VCGGAGFAVPLLMPHLFAPKETEEVSTAEPSEPVPAFVKFGDVVVNLNSDRFNRYLRVNITMQVDESEKHELEERLKKQKAVLKSWLLSYLSDHGMEEIRGAAGQNRLRREIQNQFNASLCPDGFDLIDNILFEEFSVQ
jgi:flagellar basal body-associated protein FliL